MVRVAKPGMTTVRVVLNGSWVVTRSAEVADGPGLDKFENAGRVNDMMGESVDNFGEEKDAGADFDEIEAGTEPDNGPRELHIEPRGSLVVELRPWGADERRVLTMLE
jgi:hypothetical protein